MGLLNPNPTLTPPLFLRGALNHLALLVAVQLCFEVSHMRAGSNQQLRLDLAVQNHSSFRASFHDPRLGRALELDAHAFRCLNVAGLGLAQAGCGLDLCGEMRGGSYEGGCSARLVQGELPLLLRLKLSRWGADLQLEHSIPATLPRAFSPRFWRVGCSSLTRRQGQGELLLKTRGVLSSVGLPSYETEALGGLDSLRGYDLAELGQANSLLLGTIEQRFPLSHSWLFAVFADAAGGSIVEFDDSKRVLRVRSGASVGFGVQCGPIRFDIARNTAGRHKLHLGFPGELNLKGSV